MSGFATEGRLVLRRRGVPIVLALILLLVLLLNHPGVLAPDIKPEIYMAPWREAQALSRAWRESPKLGEPNFNVGLFPVAWVVGVIQAIGFDADLSMRALRSVLRAFGLAIVGGVLIGVAAATGSAMLMVLAVGIVIVGALYAAVKTSLVAPVIAVEGQRNPVAVLQRSWRLTKGNSVRIALFYLLLLVAFLVIMMIVSAILGIVLALLAGQEGAQIGAAVISSVLGAAMTLYFVAIIASIHRQLAGPSAGAISETFE